jgi:hypothetical protein
VRLHRRHIIRNAVREQLLEKTAAADRVFKSRVVPFKRLQLPALAVYALEEPVDPESRSTAPRELTRNLQLRVECVVAASEDVDDAMDALALQVEDAIDADETFGGEAADAILASTSLEIGERGDQPIGVVSLTYAVTYYTRPSDAADPSKVDDLKTVDVKTNLSGGVHAGNQSEDKLENLDQP